MNLYFLLEGKRTEVKVYPKWVEYTFPHITQVYKIDEVISDCFYIISAKGYPRIIQLLENVLIDIHNHNVTNNIIIEHLFICLDSDEESYEKRCEIVQIKLTELKNQIKIPSFLKIHIIIQTCCIETWFLGNTKMLRKNPQSKMLSEFKKFYDVRINDPELMNCCPNNYSYARKAHFHEAYLKEMLREKNLKYSKTHPGVTTDENYFKVLRQRCKKTGHLSSLKKLFEIWEAIN